MCCIHFRAAKFCLGVPQIRSLGSTIEIIEVRYRKRGVFRRFLHFQNTTVRHSFDHLVRVQQKGFGDRQAKRLYGFQLIAAQT